MLMKYFIRVSKDKQMNTVVRIIDGGGKDLRAWLRKYWKGMALLLLIAVFILSYTRTRYFREGMVVTDVKVMYYHLDQIQEVEIVPMDPASIWIITPLASGFKRSLLPWFDPEVSDECIRIILDGRDREGKALNRDLTYYSSGLLVVVSNGDSNIPGDFYTLQDPEYGYDYYRSYLKKVIPLK